MAKRICIFKEGEIVSTKHALALVADENYLEYTKQVIAGSYIHGNWDGAYILIAFDIDPEKLRWFKDRGIYIFHAEPLITASIRYNKAKDWPVVVYAKLYLFHPFFTQWDKVLYLDTDIIIRKDIRGLMNHLRFAAREESMGQDMLYQFVPDMLYLNKAHQQAIEALPYDLKTTSFNVGVMVVPTQNNTIANFEKLTALANELHGLAYFPEQAVLNAFFYKNWDNIPYVYNDLYVHDWFHQRKDDRDAVILHLVGNNKPWNTNSPYYSEWNDMYAKADDCFDCKQVGQQPDLKRVNNIERLNLRMKWLGKFGWWWWHAKARIRNVFSGR